MKRQKILSLCGILLLLFGCVMSGRLALLVLGARVNAIFYAIVTDAPNQRFPSGMRCPLLMIVGRPAKIKVAVPDSTLQVSLDCMTIDHLTVLEGPTTSQTVRGDRLRYVWSVQADQAGLAVFTVLGLSPQDRQQTDRYFHSWPNSYRQACGILVVTSAWEYAWLVGPGIVGLGLGALLYLPQRWRRVRRKKELASQKPPGETQGGDDAGT